MRKVQMLVSVAGVVINVIGALVIVWASKIEIRDSLDHIHTDLLRQGEWLYFGALVTLLAACLTCLATVAGEGKASPKLG
jgi:hypothetical protein